MPNLTDLIATTLPSSVRVHGGTMPRITVESARGTAEVYFQGAHVTAWHPTTSRDPVLWMSRASLFEPGRPIRGGVPICFPWFGAHAADPSAPAHGFARVRDWKLIDAQEDARQRTVKVKIAAQVQPVLPSPAPGSPFTAVEFDGMTATPYVDASRCSGDGKNKCAARQAYSFKATAVRAPAPGIGRPTAEHKDAA